MIKGYWQFYANGKNDDVSTNTGITYSCGAMTPVTLAELCAEFVGTAADFAKKHLHADVHRQQLKELADWLSAEYGD